MKNKIILGIFFLIFISEIGISRIAIVNSINSSFGQCNGTITVEASGTAGPFTLEISGTNSTGEPFTDLMDPDEPINGEHTFEGLCPGNYFINSINNFGCPFSVNETIDGVSVPVIILECEEITLGEPQITDSESCENGGDGSIRWLGGAGDYVTGGTGPYSIEWSNGESNLPNMSGLAPGVYTATVTDSEGCIGNGSFEILGIGDPQVTLVEIEESCEGEDNGYIGIAVSNNEDVELIFDWSNDYSHTDINISEMSNLVAEEYCVTITNPENECTTEQCIIIPEKPSTGEFKIILEDSKEIVCFGENDGFINVSVSGGNPPYTVFWSNGSGGQSISNLSAGNYTVTAVDDCGREISQAYTIEEYDEIIIDGIIDASCPGDGALEVIASGGTPPYTYNWNHGNLEGTYVDGLNNGIYGVIVTDANGCIKTQSFTVKNISAYVIDEDPPCEGFSDGTVTIRIDNPDGDEVEISTLGLSYGSSTVTEFEIVTNSLIANEPFVFEINVNNECLFLMDPVVLEPVPLTEEFDSIDEDEMLCFNKELCKGEEIDPDNLNWSYAFVDMFNADCKSNFNCKCEVPLICDGIERGKKEFPKTKVRGIEYTSFIYAAEAAELLPASGGGPDNPGYIHTLTTAKKYRKMNECSKVKFCEADFTILSVEHEAILSYTGPAGFDSNGCQQISCWNGYWNETKSVCYTNPEILNLYGIPQIDLTVCKPKQYDIAQLVAWHEQIIEEFEEYYKDNGTEEDHESGLYKLIDGIISDPDATGTLGWQCGSVTFCESDFTILYQDIDETDCGSFAINDCLSSDIDLDQIQDRCSLIPHGDNQFSYFCPKECGMCPLGGTQYCLDYVHIENEFDGTFNFNGTHNQFNVKIDQDAEADQILIGISDNVRGNDVHNDLIYEKDNSIYVDGSSTLTKKFAPEEAFGLISHYEDFEEDVDIVVRNVNSNELSLEYSYDFNLLWQVGFNSNQNIEFIAHEKYNTNSLVIIEADSDLLINGFNYEINEKSILFCKFDEYGTLLSVNTIQSLPPDRQYKVSRNQNGQILIGAYYYNNQLSINGDAILMNFANGMAIIKYNFLTDNFSVKKEFYCNESAELIDLEVNKDNSGYFIAFSNCISLNDGNGLIYNTQVESFLILSYDSNSNLTWIEEIDNLNIDDKHFDVLSIEEGKLLCGITFIDELQIQEYAFISEGKEDVLILGFNQEGSVIYGESFGSSERENISEIRYSPSSNLVTFAGEYKGYVPNRKLGLFNFVQMFEFDTFSQAYQTNHVIDWNAARNSSVVSQVENKEFEKTAINLEPNPAKDEVVVRLSNFHECNLTIFNSSGQLVQENRISNKISTLNVSSLNTGVYFLYFKVGNSISVKKLVIVQ